MRDKAVALNGWLRNESDATSYIMCRQLVYILRRARGD